MNDDEDNTPDSGIEDVTAQAPDTAEEWDFYDPEEDTVEAPPAEATEDGTEAAPEAEVSEEPEEVEAAPNAVVTLADGSKVKASELAQSYLRQADYTRKSQELATKRQAVEANLTRSQGIIDSFVTHLSAMVPDAPDHTLALRDPNAYTRQMAQHQAALEQVKKLIEIGEQPKQITSEMTTEQRQGEIAEENRKLVDRIPSVSTEMGRKKFFEQAAEAANAMGFSNDELSQVADHRLFVMAHYAAKAIKAEKASKVVAAKVANVPPVAPKRPGQGTATGRNDEAVKRFSRAPTLKNAVAAWDGN